jgi:cholest-4-en-3-one 26-monooxygenase
VLVHAEVDGERLEEHEIVMGFFLLMAAGNDSTKATYSSGMRALLEHPDQMRAVVEDPSLVPSTVEEALRMFPAFGHFRRTATRDVELHGRRSAPATRSCSGTRRRTATRRATRIPTASTCAATPSTRPSARRPALLPGRRAGPPELRILFEETLARFPGMTLDGEPEYAESPSPTSSRCCPSG